MTNTNLSGGSSFNSTIPSWFTIDPEILFKSGIITLEEMKKLAQAAPMFKTSKEVATEIVTSWNFNDQQFTVPKAGESVNKIITSLNEMQKKVNSITSRISDSLGISEDTSKMALMGAGIVGGYLLLRKK